MRLRVDTLAQLLSYSNVTAGSQVLVMETCMGLVTGAFAQRMGGYGRVISVYSGQQPSYIDLLSKFNLTFAENHSIKWVHAGDVFAEDAINADTSKIPDQEREEREAMEWPCPLQDHTRKYLEEECTDPKQQEEFLAKRASRFARKLTRYTPVEVQEMLVRRPCDSLVIACSYDPTETLLALLPFLAPSSPFVVFCEYLEPLTECFQEIQKQKLAINLRLSDTWMREYQVLSGRTRPAMHMSQNGGFLLVGVKLCPETGNQDLDEKLLEEIRANLRPRRSRKPKEKRSEDGDEQAAIKRSKVA
jgi:tRNA (adenine-N(1)-)-methyltransferase non-catalytic subunit